MVKDINEEENAAVMKLKSRISDIPNEEFYLKDNLFYRFLKARDFNIDNAEKMLRDHLEWRKKKDVKNSSKWKLLEVLEKFMPFNLIGRDKEGFAVRYVPYGNLDWKGVVASCKYEDFERRFIQILEEDVKAPELESKNGKTIAYCKQFVYIFNVENFTFAQATNKKTIIYFFGLITMFLNNYPETVKGVYFINASTNYYLAYSIFQNFLPSALKNKMIVYSDDSYKTDLPKMIDAEILPAFLGGKRTDPDGNPLCNTFINHGGLVPEKYYIHRSNKRSLSVFSDVQLLTLPRSKFKEVFVEVKEPESYLEWEFVTKSRDIGFGLFYQDEEGNTTEIVPIVRIDTEESAETGIYKCEKAGKYTVIFDNTYSILRSKVIYYRIRVKKGKGEEIEIVN